MFGMPPITDPCSMHCRLMELLDITAHRLECSLWIWNRADRRFDYSACSSETMLGIPSPSSTQAPFEDMFKAIDTDYRQLAIEAFSALPIPVDITILAQNQVKGQRWLRLRTYPLHDSEHTLFAGITSDVTEEVEAKALSQAKDEGLQRADRLATLGVLSASLAHDLNASLNEINLASGLLDRWMHGLLPLISQLADEEPGRLIAGTTISDIRQQIPLMMRGIQDTIQRMASMHAHQLSYAKGSRKTATHIDLGHLIRGVVALVQPFLDRAQARCSIVMGHEPLMIYSQRVGIEQILTNLLTNAAQALLGRGGSISVTANEDAVAGTIIISVRDDGPSIPLEHQRLLGTGFFTTRPDGTGLGWTIIRRVLDSLQGTFVIESRPGSGTHIRITLPIRIGLDQEAVPHGMYTVNSNIAGTVRT